jgi:hypothetical protein
MLKALVDQCPDNYFYYFDISYEETLRRHATKLSAHEFGEKEMKQWYKPNQITGFKTERIIPESLSIEKTVNKILSGTGL